MAEIERKHYVYNVVGKCNNCARPIEEHGPRAQCPTVLLHGPIPGLYWNHLFEALDRYMDARIRYAVMRRDGFGPVRLSDVWEEIDAAKVAVFGVLNDACAPGK